MVVCMARRSKSRIYFRVFARFYKHPRAIIAPDALMSGDHDAWPKRLHFIESSNPLLALLLIERL